MRKKSCRHHLDYGANHVGVGDLGGDGEYDFVVKRGSQDIDPSQSIASSNTFKLEGSDWDLLVYDGKFPVALALSVPAGAAPGPIELDGSVAYQACNRNACLPPTQIPVKLTAQIAAP